MNSNVAKLNVMIRTIYCYDKPVLVNLVFDPLGESQNMMVYNRDFFQYCKRLIHRSTTDITAFIVPQAALFCGGKARDIRRHLIADKNYLELVIGLPANIFYGNNIATCMLVFKQCRPANVPILLIDASDDFEMGMGQTHITDDSIAKIIDTCTNQVTRDCYSYAAPLSEIRANNYNLNLPRYINIVETDLIGSRIAQ